MAEAHSAVAFSFSVTPDGGVDLSFNHEALWAIWRSGVVSWKKRIGYIKNSFHNGVYPSSPATWFVCVAIVFGCYAVGLDLSYGIITYISSLELFLKFSPFDLYLELVLFATFVWIGKMLILRYTLKLLLSYHGWMFEAHRKVSLVTKIWMLIMSVLVIRKPLLYTYQNSLPKMPVPSLKDTTKKFLLSVKPLLNDEEYEKMEKLAFEFSNGLGKKLQRYLILKSWWATNYVSDWWEEYVYLRGRAPIMVNSNYYGVDALYKHLTSNQAARAANVVYGFLQFRKEIESEHLTPIMLNKTIPLCSRQYERQFNTTRIPGIETDTLLHLQSTNHIVVMHKGRFFKVYVYFNHELLKPCQLEKAFETILNDPEPPGEGENELAALTAGERVPWAKARMEYFRMGINKLSLDAIERAAFVLSLETEPLYLDQNDQSKIDHFAQTMLFGNGYNRWFDKSFTLVVSSNGKIGFNAEHSWADAPVMAQLWENGLYYDMQHGYTEDGHTKGIPEFDAPKPIRLKWDLSLDCQKVIQSSLMVAKGLCEDVDLHLLVHDKFGKNHIKKCRVSPDAFIQMALQLAYYRDNRKFCLTYEASMTRLFREGRTETVRSCTIESCKFVKAMDDDSLSIKEKVAFLNEASEMHQNGYRSAMTGHGIDRHLFCLYVVSKYLGADSPFLSKVLSEPWRLSTSQTPHSQTDKIDVVKNPELIACGGGFGPVADDGYGVSYMLAGDNVIFFHISSKKSCPTTDSIKFGKSIFKALDDLKELCLHK